MPSVIRGSDLFDTNTAIGFSTNHDAATGTVTIPSGLEIGTRRLIRKIHPTQGTVTINCTGETFTRAELASVELNADGDYWLLEKVTATRWELVDGWNTGENGNGVWVRRANGEQVCLLNTTVSQAISNSYGSLYQDTRNWDYPIAFQNPPVANVGRYRHTTSASWGTVQSASATNATMRILDIAIRTSGVTSVAFSATGRWYL